MIEEGVRPGEIIQRLLPGQKHRFWPAVVQFLAGIIALAGVTFVCFRLGFNVPTTASLYLVIVVLLSLQGSLLSSAAVSLIAVGCLAYYFSPPIFSLRVDDPFNVGAIAVFLTVSTVITHLATQLRRRAEQLALTNAKLEAQLAERKRAEEALLDARAELERVTRVSSLGELTASIAHEINQPLAAVVTNAGASLRWLAKSPPDLDKTREGLQRTMEEGVRAGEIVKRIRSLVKKSAFKKDWVDLNKAILEVIDLTRSEVVRHEIALKTRLTTDLPLVRGDRIQLQQVILNLIINAVEAMRGLTPAELLISSSKDGANGVCISVGDSGRGLGEGNPDRLFEAFYSSKPDGMGMGLAISRSIIVAHGGRLWATASAPRGAVFQFTLPRGEGSPGREI
jgi:C4-dicarboxylate-specific signal transduction histidine kinase